MMPHLLPATTLREQALISRMSIALDDSEHSTRALRYVGTLLREARDVQVTLFHVLKPMPRAPLGSGCSRYDARYWGPGTGRAHSGTGGGATCQGRAPA